MRKKVGEREVKEDYNRKALNWKIMSGKNTLFMPDNLGSNLGCGSFVTPNSSLPLHFHLQLATPFIQPSILLDLPQYSNFALVSCYTCFISR
ncbi:hypothetical protein ACN38_g10267 [Penicillium nordicum]|uniref:Uncharacterized protein n=1 Tax=Penicillium nordicum TaxID=229535 RepID=A0A0M9WBT1_9EURO|nr:hypothetical protein ACN38_g10267 [Penicillium nordicum]